MGSFDARGVAAGVLADALYVGLVASDTRAEEVIDRAASILERDPEAVRAAVTNPAGVDVAAYTPAEIAASLLAEVVDVRGTAGGASGSYTPTSCGVAADSGDASSDFQTDDGVRDSGEELATDPVCGMTVDPADAPASVDHAGKRITSVVPTVRTRFARIQTRISSNPTRRQRRDRSFDRSRCRCGQRTGEKRGDRTRQGTRRRANDRGVGANPARSTDPVSDALSNSAGETNR